MRTTFCNVVFSALVLLAAGASACGTAGAGGTPSAGADASTANTTNAASDDNTRFVIPPISNSNSTAATPTGITVSNFTPADAVTYQFAVNNGIAGINAAIVLNSTPNACDDANANMFHVGEQQIVIVLTDIPDQQIAANTYVFPAAANAPYEIASATYGLVQAPCYDNSVNLVSGQVVITDVESASLSGTYTLQFSSGTVNGSFTTAPTCNAVAVTPATAPTCGS